MERELQKGGRGEGIDNKMFCSLPFFVFCFHFKPSEKGESYIFLFLAPLLHIGILLLFSIQVTERRNGSGGLGGS